MYKFFVQAILAMSMAMSPFLAFPLEKPAEGMKVPDIAQISKRPSAKQVDADVSSFVDVPSAWKSQPAPSPAYAFGNPAGCTVSAPTQSPAEMLANVQAQLPELDLSSRRLDYIYNGTLDSMVSVGDDPFVYEFSVNLYQSPFTYLADQTVTVFLQSGFVVWLRNYGGHFRLTAVPMVDGGIV